MGSHGIMSGKRTNTSPLEVGGLMKRHRRERETRHRMALFAEGSEYGFTERVTTTTLKEALATETIYECRSLGSEILTSESCNCDSTPPSVFAEGVGQKRLSAMEKQLEEIIKELSSNTAKIKKLESSNEALKLFSENAMQVTIRAFMDLILKQVYIDVRIIGREANERTTWLKSDEAAKWILDHQVLEMASLGRQPASTSRPWIAMNESTIHIFRAFKEVCGNCASNAHQALPIAVAYALEEIQGHPHRESLIEIFKAIFGITPQEMIGNHQSGLLDSEHKELFSA